ncbi:MAG: helix-turn-helix domain-containing protein [Acidobacteria bacterium]|nr:helix-turn-helix domain-containing protein [Acidobacteriota bacterium]
MATFGENLRREREMRGVTLEEISASTKIGIRFLKALEDEDLARLPGGIFTRSFVRAYAKYLGLDEDHVMAEYHLLVPPIGDNDISPIAKTRPMPKKDGSRGPIVAVLVAAALLGSGYLLYHYTRTPTEVRAPAPVVAPAVPAPAPPAPGPAASTRAAQGQRPPQEQTEVPESPVTAVLVPQSPEIMTLQVAATERSWVAVDADGKMVLQRVLDPGEFETLQAKDTFDVTTGNALGVVLTLNGETLKPLGRRGEVKTVHLTAHDARKNSP